MSTITVTTQSELDAALADESVTEILVRSPRGVWLELSSSGSATVHAYGSATVHASDSVTVHAYDSATVTASDSATVRASDSVTVHAYDSATVHASDSATVRAYDSATVHASDSVTVHAYDSATVHASKYVAVHLRSSRATVTGGVIIDVSQFDLNDPATWCDYHGVDVADGHAMLFKATDAQLAAGHKYNRVTTYLPGTTVVAGDWRDDNRCGGGLHLSQSPDHAASYCDDGQPIRWLRVRVSLASVRVIDDDKVKASAVDVVAEVDVMGRDVAVDGLT